MKLHLKPSFGLFCLIFVLSGRTTSAQINYSEESATFLAQLVAAEVGSTVGEQMDFAWKLAESLSYLTVAEQQYVFDLQDLSGIPNGPALPRPVRTPWGQKVDESWVNYTPSTSGPPAPTEVPLGGSSGAGSAFGSSSGGGSTGSGTTSGSGSGGGPLNPPVVTMLDAPSILITGSMGEIQNPNSTSFSKIQYAWGSQAWADYGAPLNLAAVTDATTLRARVVPKSGFEITYATSVEVEEYVGPDDFYGVPVSGGTLFVMDLSGSMVDGTPPRAETLKQQFTNALRGMDDGELVGVMVYSTWPVWITPTGSQVVTNYSDSTLAMVTLDDWSRNQLIKRVEDITPNGFTNFYRALAAIERVTPTPSNAIFLTDGAPTAGNSDVDDNDNYWLRGLERAQLVGVPINTVIVDPDKQSRLDRINRIAAMTGGTSNIAGEATTTGDAWDDSSSDPSSGIPDENYTEAEAQAAAAAFAGDLAL